MKTPSRWTRAAIKKAFDEGTAERNVNGRIIRIVTDSVFRLELTSGPKTKLHEGIQIGPWLASGDLEAHLAT